MAYADLNTIHNPSTGTVAPATWGDQVRDNDEFLIDPPACSVFHSTTQSVASSTNTALNANSENFDNDAMHSTVTNNTRITAQTAGRYQLQAIAEFGANSTGFRAVRFLVNGTTVLTGLRVPTVTSPALSAVNAIRTITLAATDYIEVQAFQDSGGNLNVQLLEFAATFLTR